MKASCCAIRQPTIAVPVVWNWTARPAFRKNQLARVNDAADLEYQVSSRSAEGRHSAGEGSSI